MAPKSIGRLARLLVCMAVAACGGSTQTFPDDPTTDTATADTFATDASGTDGSTDTAVPVDSGSDAPPPKDAAKDGPASIPCTAAGSECGSSGFCDAPTCEKGTCKPRPSVIGPFAPVCGCDGVSYFTGAYAESLGRSWRAGSASCEPSSAATCNTAKPCPHPDDLCTMQVASCSLAIPNGSCWGIPKGATCPTGKGAFTACGTGGPTGPCLNECEAVTSGKSYQAGCK